jgi:hypothetical protein
LIYGTFLGGDGKDAGRAGCVDDAGRLTVAVSSSGGWPLKNAFRTECRDPGDIPTNRHIACMAAITTLSERSLCGACQKSEQNA